MQKDCYTFALLYNQNKADPRKGRKCAALYNAAQFVMSPMSVK
mgnify:CR=1 FL=1